MSKPSRGLGPEPQQLARQFSNGEPLHILLTDLLAGKVNLDTDKLSPPSPPSPSAVRTVDEAGSG